MFSCVYVDVCVCLWVLFILTSLIRSKVSTFLKGECKNAQTVKDNGIVSHLILSVPLRVYKTLPSISLKHIHTHKHHTHTESLLAGYVDTVSDFSCLYNKLTRWLAENWWNPDLWENCCPVAKINWQVFTTMRFVVDHVGREKRANSNYWDNVLG